jgi:hypothetical protein
MEGKTRFSGKMDINFEGVKYCTLHMYKSVGFKPIKELSKANQEKELLVIMVSLYDLGLI